MAVLIGPLVALWLLALGTSVYFFVRSLNNAINEGREQGAERSVEHHRTYRVSMRHLIPTGHHGRRPVHS